MSLVCVVPSCRPESLLTFKEKWDKHFRWHSVQLIVVQDGDTPTLEVNGKLIGNAEDFVDEDDKRLFFNKSDCVRNYGFWFCAKYFNFSSVYTLDDDCYPIEGTDPIAEHLDVLGQACSLSWINTGNGLPLYRGFPYAVRTEGTVAASHGPWCGVPDLDAATQLTLTGCIDSDPEFFNGPIPKGVLAPICGMNLMVTRECLPHLYYAPMGPKVGLNRYADIWLGVSMLRSLWTDNKTIYTGVGKIHHSRASDVFKNLAAEAEATRLNERWWKEGDSVDPYFNLYRNCREQYCRRMSEILGLST